MEFRLLGPCEVLRDGQLIDIRGSKRRALLALLVLQANEVVRTDRLIEELWGLHQPANASASLHSHVSRLRKDLGSEVLITKPWGYVLRALPEAIDLRRFETLVIEARPLPASERKATLGEALALWRGPALADFSQEPALEAERARIDDLGLSVVEQRIDARLELGEHTDVIGELETLITEHPLRESLRGQLILALYRSGRQAEALETYRETRRVLVEELGIEPSPELRELERAILRQDPALASLSVRPPPHPGGAEPLPSRWRWPRSPLVVGAARELIERIVPLLPSANEGDRARTVYEYGIALWLLGERDRSQAALDEAVRLAAAADEVGLEELAALRRSWQALFIERPGVAAHRARARRARRVFEDQGDRASLAEAMASEARAVRDLGYCAEATRTFSKAARLAQGVGDATHETICRNEICLTVALGPTPAQQAIRLCKAEIEIMEKSGRVPYRGWWATGLLHAQGGSTKLGLELFQVAEDACRTAGLFDALALTCFFRSWVHELTGDWQRAEGDLRSSFEQFAAAADRGMHQLIAGRLARILVQLGNLDEAEELTRSASRNGAADDFSEQVAWRQGMALVEAARGRSAEARQVAREAVDLTKRSDWLNLHAETLEDLAAVESSAGKPEEACSALDEAIALYGRKGNLVGGERAQRTLEAMRARALPA